MNKQDAGYPHNGIKKNKVLMYVTAGVVAKALCSVKDARNKMPHTACEMSGRDKSVEAES